MSEVGAVSLRPTTPHDADLLLAWATDPVTRAMSLNRAAITQVDHERWLADRLSRADCHLYVAMDGDGVPVGHVRFEPAGTDWRISVVVAPDRRGQGLARDMIESGVREMARQQVEGRIVAEIRPENEASRRAFTRAGFGRRTRLAEFDVYDLTFTAGRVNPRPRLSVEPLG